jgi:hypothetical protein
MASGWDPEKPDLPVWDLISSLCRAAARRLATVLTPLEQEIQASQWILELPPDWDGEGARQSTRETWERSSDFLRTLSRMIESRFGITLKPPRILPSPHGSIDLHWKTDRFELLVNVPADPGEVVRYYGDNLQGNMPIESTCNPSDPDRKLVAWISLFL